jgi:hypothetical protein
LISRLLNGYVPITNGYCARFASKDECDRAILDEVGALKRRMAVRCRVLQAGEDTIARFVRSIGEAVDEWVRKCIAEKDQELDEWQREERRERALHVTEAIMKGT